jgi:hypothetical protein
VDREYVLFESNSILRFVQPDVYLSVLQYDIEDFKPSSRLYLEQADAFVIPASEQSVPKWTGIDAAAVQKKPLFAVQPPSFVSEDLLSFVRRELTSKEERHAVSQPR